MADVKLKPGWFRRDVELAVQQRKVGALVYNPGGLTTDELKQVYAFARRLMGLRPSTAPPSLGSAKDD